MTNKEQFDYDYNQTFKVEKGSDENNWLIYSGANNKTDKNYLMTPQLAFFNFSTKEAAEKFCSKLNKIADHADHANKW